MTLTAEIHNLATGEPADLELVWQSLHLYDDFRQFEGEQFPDRPVQLVSPLFSWHRSLEDGLNSKGINEY